MPYELAPAPDEPRILFGRYYGHVSIEDVENINDTAIDYYESVDVDKVHVLMDFSAIESHENNLLKLVRSARDSMTHPRVGWWIIWGIERPMVSYLVQMAARITRIRFKEVENKKQALQFISNILADSDLEQTS